MVSQAAARSKAKLYPAPAGKLRLLIVTDYPDGLSGLRASLQADGVEITAAASPEELNRVCPREHDLAVVDVSPARLPGVLQALRMSQGHAKISLLVEASRIVADPSLAGLLPKYQAMPCSSSELVQLARRRLTSTARPRNRRMLL
jgi:CheY-like chemotaxis protein